MVAAGSKPFPHRARVEHLFQIQDQIGTNILKPCMGWIHLSSQDVGSSKHVWLQYQYHWDRPNPPKHSTAFGEMKFESKFCLGPVGFLRGSWESPKGSTGITWVIRNVFGGGIRPMISLVFRLQHKENTCFHSTFQFCWGLRPPWGARSASRRQAESKCWRSSVDSVKTFNRLMKKRLETWRFLTPVKVGPLCCLAMLTVMAHTWSV